MTGDEETDAGGGGWPSVVPARLSCRVCGGAPVAVFPVSGARCQTHSADIGPREGHQGERARDERAPASAPPAAPCPRCQRPVIETVTGWNRWPIVLDVAAIPTLVTLVKGREVRASAVVGYRIAADGTAVVATAAGPDGNAGAGEAHDVHACGATGRRRPRGAP